jgi:hypothetical protein
MFLHACLFFLPTNIHITLDKYNPYTLTKKLGNNTIQDDAKLAVIRSTSVFISHITSAYPFSSYFVF